VKLSDFDYALPKELIAQYPMKERDGCRLLILDRKAQTVCHRTFSDIPEYLKKDDLLVLNDTKVIPARFFGRRKTGGKVEIFLLEKKNPICEALVRPSARLAEGETIKLESGDDVEVLGRGEVGRFVRFARPLDDILKEAGHIPLPPYIDRDDVDADETDYQTVFCASEGATASPTAGLHFTQGLLDRVSGIGCRVSFVTLHTNFGTFAPVKIEEIEKHRMHKEFFRLPAETIDAVRETKRAGGRVFAVGTTSARVLECCADVLGAGSQGPGSSVSGYTDLYVFPGYNFKIVDGLITNFHLPKSTLLLLVSAFAGKEFIFDAYRRAIEERYRFFSYGDAMLIC